ncbi:MAG TPA: Clp protease N-terminal domain-containing protein, partial [Hyphomicrobium sp.]|nr:Clp protease N-terminal domain-containing protein [Hyphomicrobium sp.]
MDYRGPDLDLKTTRLGAASTEARREASGTPPASATARPANVRSGPIWVDEVVIACANHAYDVALAYRAAEVSLPHLLLAMTRVDAAAVALDARGIRVGALRRESAVAIASEPPAAEAGVPPRGAPELEDVLRLASSRASHAGHAATVDEVVQALADIGGDLPGGDLIMRYVPRAARDIWGTQAAPSRPLAAALGFELGEPDRSPASAGGGAATAASAAPSIDPAVLQSVLERLSTVERGLGERFSALEAAIAKQSPQSAADLSPLEKRLAAIESALSAGAESQAARPLDGEIAQRLSAIDEVLSRGAERGKELRPFDAELSQRLFAIEDAIKKAGAPAGDGERPVDAAIAGRLAAIEQALDDERVDRADGIT